MLKNNQSSLKQAACLSVTRTYLHRCSERVPIKVHERAQLGESPTSPLHGTSATPEESEQLCLSDEEQHSGQ